MFESNSESVSVLNLYKDVIQNKININPKYQRGIVWDLEKKKSFIDSIVMGIVPNNIIFNVSDETEKWTCIDGKQRLTSIIEFIRNEFNVLSESMFLYYNDKHRKSFTPKKRSQFNRRKLMTVTYLNLDYRNQLEIFSRIQNGLKLTFGEIIPSYFLQETDADLYVDFCDNEYDDIKKFVSNSKNRRSHFVMIARLLYVSNITIFEYPKKNSIIRYIKSIESLEKEIVNYQRSIKIMRYIINDERFPKLLLFQFILLYYLIHNYIVKKNILDFEQIKSNVLKFSKLITRFKNETIKNACAIKIIFERIFELNL